MADESTILTDTPFDEIKKPDEAEATEPTTDETEAPVPTDELGAEPELGDADTDVEPAPELSDEELEKLTAPEPELGTETETESETEADAEASEGDDEAEGTDEPKVDPLTVSQTGSPSADEAYPAGEPAIAPDLETVRGDDKETGELPSVVDTSEAPTDTSALNPMATGETTSTPAPEDHTGPLEGDVKVAADTSARDMAAVLSGSSVGASKEAGDVAEADDADTSDEVEGAEAQGHLGDDAPMPEITPQPSKAEAEAAKPLSAVVTGPNQPAMDAMPEAAQQHMAQWLTPPDTNGQVEPAHGQLPNSRTLPGTQDDATAIAGEIKPVVANNATSETAPTKAAPYHMPLVEGVKDEASEGDDNGDESKAEGAEGVSEKSGAEGGDNSLPESEDGVFGEAKVENGPLGELAGDGIDAVKCAAEYAHTAQGQLQQIPVMLLELEHKDLLFRMREVLAEVVVLADRLFHRR